MLHVKNSVLTGESLQTDLCSGCLKINASKCEDVVNLSGHLALMTGGRVKIGFQIALRLLCAGCTVLVVTRFPLDSCIRYSKEVYFVDFRDRLHIYGLDLRHLKRCD